MAKRGPKTDAGKAAVRYNAVRHGIHSPTPVLPGIEREEDWQAHRAGIVADLRHEGTLEEFLVDRVALTSWQLMRLTRYQRERVVQTRKNAETQHAVELFGESLDSLE